MEREVKAIEDYRKLREELELYRTGKIIDLVTRYYEMLIPRWRMRKCVSS